MDNPRNTDGIGYKTQNEDKQNKKYNQENQTDEEFGSRQPG
jgi:hypothetical protein